MLEKADTRTAHGAASANPQGPFDRAVALYGERQLADAERLCVDIIRQQPDHLDALHLLGIIALDTRRCDRAVEILNRAAALGASRALVHNSLGDAYRAQGQSEQALASYDKAIELQADLVAAHNGRGNALMDLQRPFDALASCETVLSLSPAWAGGHYNKGNALLTLGRAQEALSSFDRAIELNREHAQAHNNRGTALRELRRLDEALGSYDTALALAPDFMEAHNNRGILLLEMTRLRDALASCDRAVELRRDSVEAHYNRGNACRELKRFDQALFSYTTALALKPDLIGLEGDRLHVKMRLCDWQDFDAEAAHLVSSVQQGKANAAPWILLTVPASPDDQLRCAQQWVAKKCPLREPLWHGERYHHDRVRIAYLSADFRHHATSFLIAGMFESHDRSRFETVAISFGNDDRSDLRRRLEASFDRFVDAQTYSDDQIADFMRSSEIDIAVDLKGFTMESRSRILARRAAPIQVNFLGYPGTMGASYIDYIIADPIVIPSDHRAFYSEKVVTLPGTYQVNDTKRSIATSNSGRAEAGLPTSGFVYCCFNNSYKITPALFDRWMRILKEVKGSVIWLIDGHATATANLRKEAAARGVNPQRLVFAQHLELAAHLARHGLADLFLDTVPCNAHTTASDALWAGLPVLTCLGETFAGRVAASLLQAVGLPELVTATLDQYEQEAIRLAHDPKRLATLKSRLLENRETAPLFDTKGFTRRLETAYSTMVERHRLGLAPDHIVVAR